MVAGTLVAHDSRSVWSCDNLRSLDIVLQSRRLAYIKPPVPGSASNRGWHSFSRWICRCAYGTQCRMSPSARSR